MDPALRAYANYIQAIGKTPLILLSGYYGDRQQVRNLWAKDESFNPSSIKDRIGLSMIDAAESEGRLRPGGIIIEPTSGNTGAGLVLAAKLKGYKLIAVVPDKFDSKIRWLRAMGATVHVVRSDVGPESADYFHNVARRLAETLDGGVMLDQFNNPANPDAHYKTTGPEIWEQTEGRITHLYAGMATCGTLVGISRALKERNDQVKVIAADPEGSIYQQVIEFYKRYNRLPNPEEIPEYKIYLVEGVGEDNLFRNFNPDLVDLAVSVSDQETIDTMWDFGRRTGRLIGSSSAMSLAAALRDFEVGKLTLDDFVVVVFPDGGSNYVHTFYNPAWLTEQGIMPPENRDIDLEARIQKILGK